MYDYARSIYNPDLKGTPYGISDRYAVVVESSESATYITPYFEGAPVKQAVKRYIIHHLDWTSVGNYSQII